MLNLLSDRWPNLSCHKFLFILLQEVFPSRARDFSVFENIYKPALNSAKPILPFVFGS